MGVNAPPTHTHPLHRLFELLNKNSGLCIKLQFGETKLSEGIIILISKKKIKPLQIFLDYSTLGDLFPPPIFFTRPNCRNPPNAASVRQRKTFNNNLFLQNIVSDGAD